jgi:hypothetical protein
LSAHVPNVELIPLFVVGLGTKERKSDEEKERKREIEKE